MNSARPLTLASFEVALREHLPALFLYARPIKLFALTMWTKRLRYAAQLVHVFPIRQEGFLCFAPERG